MASLTPGQRKVLREIQAAPSYARASPKVRKALLEAAAVESNFSTPNQAQSDRDSEGVLQQRPSQGWGPTSESNTTDAEQFLRRAIPLASKYGSAGALAQAVQRSAFPDRYNQRSGLVSQLLGGYLGRSTRASAASSGSGGGRTRTTTTTTPGVDNSQARALLVQQFLGNKNSDVLDFALQARQLKDIAPTTSTRTERLPGQESPDAASSNTGPANASKFGKSHSPLLELIHKGGPGYAVKNGRRVNGSQFYAAVWDGHADHVHVAAGPKTIVQLGRLAQQMGLRVGENPHFGGVAPVHTKNSYHYRGEAIDVSGDPRKMNEYAARVERLYGLKG